MIRPFELSDIVTLNRYRRRGLFLDPIPTLTWGEGLVPLGAAFSPFANAAGVFTFFYQDKEKASEAIIGQVAHTAGSSFAHFTFLAPDSAIASPELAPLLEALIEKIGKRGAANLIAEVDEHTQTFENLRLANFSIYARQQIWRISQKPKAVKGKSAWRGIAPIDEIAVRQLYTANVPPMVQQVEPPPWQQLRGWVYYQEKELLAFADASTGPRGIWLQPFIHPELENAGESLLQLVAKLKARKKRPVYICLRSYQSWLGNALIDAQAEIAAEQAVMVRRLAAPVKKAALAPIPQINGNTEATTSYYEVPEEQ